MGVRMTGDSLKGTLEGRMGGTWAIMRDRIYLKFDLLGESDLNALASLSRKLEESFS